MIQSFRDKDTEVVWQGERTRKFRAVEEQALRRMVLIHRAKSLDDLAYPGCRLEKLKGDRKGQYSIRVNDQYRICFEWRSGDAFNVELTDYH